MKLKKVITFIFMMLFFVTGYANEGIPNTLITKNPNKEVTTVKTNRRKEFAEFNIEVNKIKSKEIQGLIKAEEKEILFDITHIDTPISEKDFIFVTEELETFPSYSETNGKRKWSNVMEKYKEAYKNKVPVDNNGLRYSVISNKDEIEGTTSRILKVKYENAPNTLHIGIVDSVDYSLKAIYKFSAGIELYNTRAGETKAYVTFTNAIFDYMTLENLKNQKIISEESSYENIKSFENIKITKKKGEQLNNSNSHSNYLTITSSDSSFLDVKDGKTYNDIEKLKITNMNNTKLTLEVEKNKLKTLHLTDGSVFKISFEAKNNNEELEITVIPVIFGTDPEANFKVELFGKNNENLDKTQNIFYFKYPDITHRGIVVGSKDGTKNTLSPNSSYEIGKEDNSIIEHYGNTMEETLKEEQKEILGEHYGLDAKGKNLKYLFYLLGTNKKDLSLQIEDPSGKILPIRLNSANSNGNTITYDFKESDKKEISFILDKDNGIFKMQVPKWDTSKIIQKFKLQVVNNSAEFKNTDRIIYQAILDINLPETRLSQGKISINLYAKYEREFNNGQGKAIHLINPETAKKLDFLGMEVEGEYPTTENIIIAKNFSVNEGDNSSSKIDMNFKEEYSLQFKELKDINIFFKQSIGKNKQGQNEAGISLGFDETNWKKFLEKKSFGKLELKLKDFYGNNIGNYRIHIYVKEKRKATFYLNGLDSLFAGSVPSRQINTGKIFGLSNQIPYIEKDNSFKDEKGNNYSTENNIKTGNIFGATVTGDELRYYNIDPNNIDDKTKIVIRSKSDGGKYAEYSHTLKKDEEIDVLTNNGSKLFIGFKEQQYDKRDYDGSKKELALYFRLVKYDARYYFFTNETINVAIVKDGVELYRDEVNIVINKTVPNITDIDINILKHKGNDGKEYYGRTFIVDGDLLKEEKTGEIFGSVSITGSKGDFPMNLNGVEKFHGQYRVRYDGAILSYANIGDTNIDQIKNGYYLPLKDESYRHDNNITIWNTDKKEFKLKIDKSKWEDGNFNIVTYLTTDLNLILKGKNIERKYNFGFFERTNPKHIKGLGKLKINIRDGKLDDYINKYILNANKNGDNNLEITATANGNAPNMNGFDSDIFDIQYEQISQAKNGQTNLFNMADTNKATTAYYKFYNDYRLIGTGSNNIKVGNIEESNKKEISFLDGTKIKFGFSMGKNTTDPQKLLYRLLEFGDDAYAGKKTYKTSVHLDGGREAGGGAFSVTDIEFTIPKLDYWGNKKILIEGTQENKNGLSPDLSFYFGLKDGEITTDPNNINKPKGDVLKITQGGAVPYAILRGNEIPISTLDSFIEFHQYDGQTAQAKYLNSKWYFTFKNEGTITFELIGDRGDGVEKNKIKMTIRDWNNTQVDKHFKMRVYSKDRTQYFEFPIWVNIKPTKQQLNKNIEINLDDKYKEMANVYSGRFSFYKSSQNGKAGKEEFEVKKVGNSGEKLGTLNVEQGVFNPVKTDEIDVSKNILLNGNKLEVEIDGKRISLGKGDIFQLKSGLNVYIGYNKIGENKEILEMGTDRWTSALNESFKLIVKNNYDVVIASYNITLKGNADVKDSAIFNFGTINSASKNFETTVMKSVKFDSVIDDIDFKFSNENPILTLNGMKKDKALPNQKLHVTEFKVVYAEKDRLDLTTWNYKITGRLEEITSNNRKQEGKYFNPEEVYLHITSKDSGKGTRVIK